MAFAIETICPHVVDVEYDAGGVGTNKGNKRDWQPLAAGVKCLISQGSGSRPEAFYQQAGQTAYTVTGGDESLARDDVRFTVVVGPRAGKTLRVVGVSTHGPVAGVVDVFYRARCVEDVT